MAEFKNYLDKLGLGAFLAHLKKIFAPISHTHTKSEVGLGNVDNTADINKSVKYATNAGAAEKVNGHTVASDVPANAKFTDTTYTNFVKSGSGAKAGLVPTPSTTAGTSKYLREDGTWTAPPNTTYNDATQSTHGLMSKTDKTKLDSIAEGANKTVVDSVMSDTSTNPVQNKLVKSELDKKSNVEHTHTVVNGHTVKSDVPENAKFTDTWRGVQNNLTSNSTTDSLSAAQGKALKELVDGKAASSHTHDDRYYTESEINTKLAGKANSSHTHGNADITTLDASKLTGTIDIARLPQGALERLVPVTDDAARFKLTNADVQLGDTVKVASTGKMYYVVNESKLSSEEGYEVYTAGTATSAPWSGITGKPSTYTPSAHNHTKSEVGLGNVDNTSDANKSVKYATTSGSSTSAAKAAQLTTSRTIDGVNFNGTAAITHFGTCSTDAATAAKVVSLTGFALVNGAKVTVKFTTTNTAANPTLNVNGTGAKAIKYRGSAITASSLAANRVYEFVYDGTDYLFMGDINTDTNTTYSDVTQSVHGLMSAADKKKLDGISDGANKYAHPTTSGNKHIPSGGSNGQILRWSADGTAVWGNDNDTKYTEFVKSGSTAKSGLVPAPPTTAGTTKYLREDGMWFSPPNTNTTYSAGSGISFSGTTINHKNSVTASTAKGDDNKTLAYGKTFTIPSVTYDAQGHITAKGSTTMTMPPAPSSVSGNAGTATKLATARSISLGTAGSGSVNFDGSGDVTLPLTSVKEAYLSWGGKGIANDITPIDAAMSSVHNANRAQFCYAAGVTIEYSNDAGATWKSYAISDTEKRKLMSNIGSSVSNGNHNSYSNVDAANDRLRITLNASNMGLYTALKKILINLTTNGASGASVKVEKSNKGSETTWVSAGTYALSGWSGWNSLPIGCTFGGGSSQTGNTANIRMTFYITGKSSSSSSSSVLQILNILLFGTTYWYIPSAMAKDGHLYSYDIDQNATFPAKVTAKSFSGDLTGNASTATSLTSSAGSATQPVYFSNGKPVAGTYTLGKSVPSNAVFTDTNTKVTSVGNHYTPSGGTTTAASGGALTDITNSSSGIQVITGITKDAAGHVTGVTSAALKSVNTNTTYGNFVKSGSGAKAGLVPAPSTTAGTTKYLREDGTWVVPPNTNTWTAFKGATASAAGTAGYVPAPAKGTQDKFFKADGTWSTPVEFMTDTEFNTLISGL